MNLRTEKDKEDERDEGNGKDREYEGDKGTKNQNEIARLKSFKSNT